MRPANALRVIHPAAGANPRRAGDELLLTFGFRCNFACQFCYVEDGLGDRFRGVTLDEARRLLADPALTAGVTRIVLSGGEVTLDKDLPAFVALARAVPTVAHVRIQTNASRLADRAQVDRLLAVGVDEFFVSLHGADAATCDRITGVTGSFDAITAGLAALGAAGATVITNTVVCATNLAQLDRVVTLAADAGAVASELWGYVPRVDAEDRRALLVRVGDAAPLVQRAVVTGLGRGVAMTVKYFPRCLLGPVAHVHSDAQPRLVIDDAFWQDYPSYGCLYHGVCADAAEPDGCSGLADSYVHRFGWEEHVLAPRGAEVVPEAAPIARYHDWGDRPRPALSDAAVDLSRWGFGVGAPIGRHHVVAAVRRGDAIVVTVSAGDDAIAIALERRDPARACFARTASLDLTHPPLAPEVTAQARPLLAAFAARLAAVDDGDLAVAWWQAPAAAPPREALWPAALPGGDAPVIAAVLAAIEALVAAGTLAPAGVEPSVALGEPPHARLLINPSIVAGDRAAVAAAILAAVAAPGWLTDHAVRWLAAPQRVALLGIAADGPAPRLKLYLDTRAAADRAAAVALLGGPSPSPTTTMIAIDVRDGAIVGYKHYRPITAAAARAGFAGPLLELLEARGLLLGELRLLESTRTGAAPDRALHVDVARFAHLGLGAAWAQRCGDLAAADQLTACDRPTRVLSVTAGTAAGRHVYLGGRR